jgi:hypothetical protein
MWASRSTCSSMAREAWTDGVRSSAGPDFDQISPAVATSSHNQEALTRRQQADSLRSGRRVGDRLTSVT